MLKLQFFFREILPKQTMANSWLQPKLFVYSFQNLRKKTPPKKHPISDAENALTPKTKQKFPQISHCLTPNSTLICKTNKLFLPRFPPKKLKSFQKNKKNNRICTRFSYKMEKNLPPYPSFRASS